MNKPITRTCSKSAYKEYREVLLQNEVQTISGVAIPVSIDIRFLLPAYLEPEIDHDVAQSVSHRHQVSLGAKILLDPRKRDFAQNLGA